MARGQEGLSIVYRPIGGLRPYASNPRTHTAKQIVQLQASLGRYGWTTPLIVAGDDLLAGHGRLAAALNMQAEGRPIARHKDLSMVPTVDLSALTLNERKAYIIADNKLAQEAGWDNNLLRNEMTALKLADFDLTLTGFHTKELGTLLGTTGPAEGPRLPAGMRYQVVIECEGESHQARLLTDLAAQGLAVRPLIL